MRYMRYVGLKNTLLPHLRQRQRSSIHIGTLIQYRKLFLRRCELQYIPATQRGRRCNQEATVGGASCAAMVAWLGRDDAPPPADMGLMKSLRVTQPRKVGASRPGERGSG
eukprot:COSAG01_NODE_860_length_13064_cov_23.466949_19_plen_110_part_00